MLQKGEGLWGWETFQLWSLVSPSDSQVKALPSQSRGQNSVLASALGPRSHHPSWVTQETGVEIISPCLYSRCHHPSARSILWGAGEQAGCHLVLVPQLLCKAVEHMRNVNQPSPTVQCTPICQPPPWHTLHP